MLNLILLLCLNTPETLTMLHRIEYPHIYERPTCDEVLTQYRIDGWKFVAMEGDYLNATRNAATWEPIAFPRFNECMTGPYNWGCGPDSVFKRFQSVCNHQDEDGDLDVDLQDWAQKQNQLQTINLKHNHGDNPNGGD